MPRHARHSQAEVQETQEEAPLGGVSQEEVQEKEETPLGRWP
jgi:hypothetical protein